jgi:hypothetical protein
MLNDVEFTEEKETSQQLNPFEQRGGSKLARWVISMGVAKDERSANIVLFILSVIIFGIAIWVAFF